MDPFEVFKKIEIQEDVQSIKVGNEELWPIIRLKVFEELRNQSGIRSRSVKFSFSTLRVFLSVFFFGFKNIFFLFKADKWVFSASDRRKKFKDLYHDRVVEDLLEIFPNSLLIENPLPLGKHYKFEEIPCDRVLGQTILYALSYFVSVFVKVKIENEVKLIEIIDKLNLKFNYRKIYSQYRGQYLLTKVMLRFAKVQEVYMVYTGSSYGYIQAFKERGIRVIELQHGVINEKHLAYNLFKKFNKVYYPDYLYTFGISERKVFNDNNFFINRNHVIPVGYSFLDKSMSFNNGTRTNFKGKYEKIVAFSFQEPFAKFSIDFLIECANIMPQVAFLLVLRNPDYQTLLQTPENLIIDPAINIYNAFDICDIHSTINSTTVLEALFFGKPNILFDFNGQPMSYFSELSKLKSVNFVKSAGEFEKRLYAFDSLSSTEIQDEGKEFFVPDFRQNLLAQSKTFNN